MNFVIVTGLSGAGKSTAAKALEDIGYYCIDNIPLQLARSLVEFSRTNSEITKFAIVADARSKAMFAEAGAAVAELKAAYGAKILFLDATNESIARRYRQTRRSHPFAIDNPDLSTVSAIEREREMLSDVRSFADYIVDTTFLSMAELKEKVSALFLKNTDAVMRIDCVSFGFKHGSVSDADIQIDARCLINPFYVDELREKTGLDPDVKRYIMNDPQSKGYLDRLFAFLDYSMPLYVVEGRSRLVIAVGCTGGKHRSVMLAQMLYERYSQMGYTTGISHRDISKA